MLELAFDANSFVKARLMIRSKALRCEQNKAEVDKANKK